MKKKTILCLFLSFTFYVSQAAFLRDVPRQLIQPNGDTLHCYASGDEFYNYLHDKQGYTIIQNVNTGYFVYAAKMGEEIIPTAHIAGKVDPASVNLAPHARISPAEWQRRREQMLNAVSQRPETKSSQRNQGHLNNLAVFIRFNGDDHLTNTFNTVQYMFNDSATVSSNSMYNYFKSASYNQLSIVTYFYPAPQNDTILSYEDIYSRNYYIPYSSTNTIGYRNEYERGNREFALLERAVNHVKSSISPDLNLDYNNDGLVDNICFIVKGSVDSWGELLWPHRWSLTEEEVYIGELRVWDFNFQLEGSSTYFTTSTLCHEMFHSLGAPDLYHYYNHTEVHPVGTWDLMEHNTNPPQHSGAYMKMKYGNWIDSIPEITEAGTYSLRPIGSVTSENTCYKIASSDTNQFYVLEYRDSLRNFEIGLPGSGLLIYRIDSRYNGNAYSSRDEVYVFRSDGAHLVNGNINAAHLGAHVGRSSFNHHTNPAPFLPSGIPQLINISDITMYGDSLTFTFNTPSVFSASLDSIILTNKYIETISIDLLSSKPWQLSPGSQGWLSCNPSSGTGSSNIRVHSRNINQGDATRIDTIVISANGEPDILIPVLQDVTIFNIQDTLLFFPLEGGDQQVYIETDVLWVLMRPSSWVTVTPDIGGENGDITVSVTPYNGAEARYGSFDIETGYTEQRIYITQWGSSGIAEQENPHIHIYPNPVQNVVNVKLKGMNYRIAEIQIFDMYGKTLYYENRTGYSAKLSVEHLPQGLYILQVRMDNGTMQSVKFIK